MDKKLSYETLPNKSWWQCSLRPSPLWWMKLSNVVIITCGLKPLPSVGEQRPPDLLRRLRTTISSVQAMSLWLRRKDKDGKTRLYALPFSHFIIAIIGIMVALLLPLIQAVRTWLSG